MRPVLPRTSSAASGLRFCGMMELPVVIPSPSLTKPKLGLVQIVSSSAKRERWVAQMAQVARNSIAKSRLATLSRLLRVGASNPSAAAVAWRSIGKPVPHRAAAPSGHSLRRMRASFMRE